MKVLIHVLLRADLKTQLREEFPKEELIFRDEISEETLQDTFSATSVILGNPPPALLDSKAPHLAFWQLVSTGFDQYAHIGLRIPVANMGDFYAHSCTETIIAGILAFYRGVDQLVLLKADKKWKSKGTYKRLQLLHGKQVIILGSGAIGLAIKNLISCFGCHVQTTAKTNPEADIHSFEALLKALPSADLIINALPGTAEKFASTEFFDAMKTDSVYAAIGRGNTTDEDALLQMLESGKIAGAVLDVTATEPIPSGSKLWEMDNVILTQHTGGSWREEEDGIVELFIANLHKFLNGEQPSNLVNLQKGY